MRVMTPKETEAKIETQRRAARIIEHRGLESGVHPKTVISRKCSGGWKPGDEPYRPVNDKRTLHPIPSTRLWGNRSEELSSEVE